MIAFTVIGTLLFLLFAAFMTGRAAGQRSVIKALTGLMMWYPNATLKQAVAQLTGHDVHKQIHERLLQQYEEMRNSS